MYLDKSKAVIFATPKNSLGKLYHFFQIIRGFTYPLSTKIKSQKTFYSILTHFLFWQCGRRGSDTALLCVRERENDFSFVTECRFIKFQRDFTISSLYFISLTVEINKQSSKVNIILIKTHYEGSPYLNFNDAIGISVFYLGKRTY